MHSGNGPLQRKWEEPKPNNSVPTGSNRILRRRWAEFSLFVAHGNYECSVIVVFALQCYFRLYLKY